jgi:hypothetical protein
MSEEGTSDSSGLAPVAGELEQMRDCLLNEQRRVRKASLSLIVTVATAAMCVWAGVLPSMSSGTRCLLAIALVLQGVTAAIWIRRCRLAHACRDSYKWHVEWLERKRS